MILKYKDGTKIRSLIDRDSSHGRFKKGEIYTVAKSRYNDSYKIIEHDKDAGWNPGLIEDFDKFTPDIPWKDRYKK